MGIYCTLFNQTGTSGSTTAIFSPSRGGGESAGSVAYNGSSSSFSNYGGGETAGSVASSSGGGSSCGCSCSFSAIA